MKSIKNKIKKSPLFFNRILIITTIIFIGLNLRPIMAAVGPLLDQIRMTTDVSFQVAGLLTGLPILAMGILALGGSALYRIGVKLGITIGLLLLFFSSVARAYWFSATGLLLTALVAGIGIGIIQVLMPGFIKQTSAKEAASLIAVYLTSVMAGAAIAAMLSPHLAQHLQWSDALAIWSVLVLFALLLWQALRIDIPANNHAQFSLLTETRLYLNLFINLRAWLLAIFFGLLTSTYTLLLAWLAPFYLGQGWSAHTAGTLLAILTLFSVFSGVIVSIFVSRWKDRRYPLLIALLLEIIGFLCLLLIPDAAWIAITFLGSGLGVLFPLSLIVTVDHTSDPERAGILAAFVQGIGYVIASFMPYLVGILRDTTGNFELAWIVMILVIFSMFPIVWLFSPASIKAYDLDNPSS